ncbi:transcriptional regulator [Actinoalloteichus sp. AHMU CJ021]|uniref:helix-turn-helix transcriptional regulator n=1 Tax=Actinoalloteichus sp. AHMU CJ021 TaxID=2072503 RepID=UPI000CA0284D|nr:transcriptional regulator [Actinoalloteichus sp. AHMU CJ021]
MADVTQRSLALLAALRNGQPVSGEELARLLEVDQRTIRRDVERLRGYGYEVDAQPGPGGYYRMPGGNTVPPIPGAVAGADGPPAAEAADHALSENGGEPLAATGRRALDQLTQHPATRTTEHCLPGDVDAAGEPGWRTGTGGDSADLVGAALQRCRVLTFDYTDAAGVVSTRRVEPHRRMHQLMRWYLLAWDAGRRDWRVFRMDRISEPRVEEASFAPRPLPPDDGVGYPHWTTHRSPLRVVVTVEAPVAAVADVLRHQQVEFLAVRPDRTRAVLAVESWQWLVLNLAFLDVEFTVEEPEEVRSACASFASRLGLASTSAPVAP